MGRRSQFLGACGYKSTLRGRLRFTCNIYRSIYLYSTVLGTAPPLQADCVLRAHNTKTIISIMQELIAIGKVRPDIMTSEASEQNFVYDVESTGYVCGPSHGDQCYLMVVAACRRLLNLLFT
jgi:hypothetical protein